MGDQVTLFAAFGAGFLSFISPCVLPLIPGYLSFVSGVSLEEMRDGAASPASRAAIPNGPRASSGQLPFLPSDFRPG